MDINTLFSECLGQQPDASMSEKVISGAISHYETGEEQVSPALLEYEQQKKLLGSLNKRMNSLKNVRNMPKVNQARAEQRKKLKLEIEECKLRISELEVEMGKKEKKK